MRIKTSSTSSTSSTSEEDMSDDDFVDAFNGEEGYNPLPSAEQAIQYVRDVAEANPRVLGKDYQDLLNFRQKARDAIVVSLYYALHPNSPLSRTNAQDEKATLLKKIIKAAKIVNMSYKKDDILEDDELAKLIRQLDLFKKNSYLSPENLKALFSNAENVIKKREISLPNALNEFTEALISIKDNPRYFDSSVEKLEKDLNQANEWLGQWRNQYDSDQERIRLLTEQNEQLLKEVKELKSNIPEKSTIVEEEKLPEETSIKNVLGNLLGKKNNGAVPEMVTPKPNNDIEQTSSEIEELQLKVKDLYDKMCKRSNELIANTVVNRDYKDQATRLGYKIVNGKLEKIDAMSVPITRDDLLLTEGKLQAKLDLLSEEHLNKLISDKILEDALIMERFNEFGKLANKINDYVEKSGSELAKESLAEIAKQFELKINSIHAQGIKDIEDKIADYVSLKSEEDKLVELQNKINQLEVLDKQMLFDQLAAQTKDFSRFGFTVEQVKLVNGLLIPENGKEDLGKIGTQNRKLNKYFQGKFAVAFKPGTDEIEKCKKELYENIDVLHKKIDSLRRAANNFYKYLNLDNLNNNEPKAKEIAGKINKDIKTTIEDQEKNIALFFNEKIRKNANLKEFFQIKHSNKPVVVELKPQSQKQKFELNFTVDPELEDYKKTNLEDAKDFACELAVNLAHKLMNLKDKLKEQQKECKALNKTIEEIPSFFANKIVSEPAKIATIVSEIKKEVEINHRKKFSIAENEDIQEVIINELRALGVDEKKIDFKIIEENPSRIKPTVTDTKVIVSPTLLQNSKVFQKVNNSKSII